MFASRASSSPTHYEKDFKSVDDVAALKALVAGSSRFVFTNDGKSFTWLSGNRSAEILEDPNDGYYVAPNSDATGASGCYRLNDDLTAQVKVSVYGPDGTASGDTAAFENAKTFAKNSGRLSVLVDTPLVLNGPIAVDMKGLGITGVSRDKVDGANGDIVWASGSDGFVISATDAGVRSLSMRTDPLFTVPAEYSLVSIDNGGGENIYDPYVINCHLEGAESAVKGYGVSVKSNNFGVIGYDIRKVHFWGLVWAQYFEVYGSGFIDKGITHDIRYTRCQGDINIATGNVMRNAFTNCVGRYENGYASGDRVVVRGNANRFTQSFEFDSLSTRRFLITSEAHGTVLDGLTVGRSRKIQDEGFWTYIGEDGLEPLGNGEGESFYSFKETFLGADLISRWNVRGSRAVVELASIDSSGRSAYLRSGFAAAGTTILDFNDIHCFGPQNDGMLRAYIYLEGDAVIADGRVEVGVRRTDAQDDYILLSYEASAGPNWFIEMKSNGTAITPINTGVAVVKNKPYPFSINMFESSLSRAIVHLNSDPRNSASGKHTNVLTSGVPAREMQPHFKIDNKAVAPIGAQHTARVFKPEMRINARLFTAS